MKVFAACWGIAYIICFALCTILFGNAVFALLCTLFFAGITAPFSALPAIIAGMFKWADWKDEQNHKKRQSGK